MYTPFDAGMTVICPRRVASLQVREGGFLLYPSILDLLRRVAIFCPPAHTGIRGSGLSVKLDRGKVHEVERGHLIFPSAAADALGGSFRCLQLFRALVVECRS